MIDYKLIGKRIKQARVNLNLTQQALAEKLDVSTNYLSKVEGGHEKPNLDFLGRISIATEISLPELLTGVVERSRYLRNDIAKILDMCSPEKTRLIYDIISRISKYD